MAEPIKIDLEINLEEIKDTITEAIDLNDNEQLFSKLVEVYRAKKKINDVIDQLISIETEVKGLIKSKADALYGNEWSAIKGKDYKITKSGTGSVFNIVGKAPKQFLVIKESLDSKLVENFIKETGKLPKGIEYNPSRGYSIRVSVSDNE